jgi:hypothetical protein
MIKLCPNENESERKRIKLRIKIDHVDVFPFIIEALFEWDGARLRVVPDSVHHDTETSYDIIHAPRRR